MLRGRWLLCTLLLLVTSALAQSPSGKVKMVVIVTRHGVRAPLAASAKSPYTRDPWPSLSEWGVKCAADLTPTGHKLATLLGAYYSDYYVHEDLLPNSCPSREVYIWADIEQRTNETARALAAGLAQKFPGCRVPVNSLGYTPSQDCGAEKQHDYFFHPLANPALQAKVQAKKLNEVAEDIKRSLPGLHTQYAKELTSLQKVLMCCEPGKCPDQRSSCTLLDLPDAPKVTAEHKLEWPGTFSAASTATENLLLEYATGLPCSVVGWGRVSYDYTKPDCDPAAGQSFRQIQRLHTVYFDKVDRAPYLARIEGSNLANQVLQALQKGVAGSGPRLVIFSGHDTNVANLAALLHVKWVLSDLPENDTPPAGALVFELYAGANASDSFVQLRYVHARMDQMRTQAVLSLSNPPEWSGITIPNCADPCSFSKFQTIMTNAIDKNFTTTSASGK